VTPVGWRGGDTGVRARLGGVIAPLLRAYAAVAFCGSVPAGLILAAATFLAPARGALGLLAVLAADLTARRLGWRDDLRRAGYYGFNALLVGLWLAQREAPSVRLALLVVVAAGAATALTGVLGERCARGGLPVLALPYLLVATLLAHPAVPGAAAPLGADAAALATDGASRLDQILAALGGLVLQPTRGGGLLVLAGVLLWSRLLGLTLLGGATLGVAVAHAWCSGEPGVVLAAGYNAALTAAALGAVLFVPDRQGLSLAIVGAMAAAWLSAAWLHPLAPRALPVLAWPFVLVTLVAVRALSLRSPGRAPWPALLPAASPEANLRYVAMSRARLAVPGPPRFVLPVGPPRMDAVAAALPGARPGRSGPSGPDTWVVTQGVRGALTHQEPWAHALDLEVIDREGFPFRGHGMAAEDYYCFGQPVLAPGAGTVVAVHEGAPDNPPGAQDTERPWGNAVVIHHGPALYSVVAHLRRGSVVVREGDFVAAAQPIAQCGSSGRSPRPHLHFQAQPSPLLGAPTLEFCLVDYCVRGRSADRHHRLGVPAEGVAIGALAPTPILLAFAELAPGRTLELESGRATFRCRSEISLLGERSLVDEQRGDRLFFVPHAGGVVFTTLLGSPSGPLGLLYQTLPFVPAVGPRATPLRIVEELPATALLPRPLRLFGDLLRFAADPLSARVRLELRWQDGEIDVTSEVAMSAFGRVLRRRRGHARIDAEGLRLLEQVGGPSWSRPRAAAPWRAPAATGSPTRAGGAPACAAATG